MPVTVKGPTFSKYAAKVRRTSPIKKCLNAIASDLKSTARSHGWQRFNSSILTKETTASSGVIYVADTVSAGRMSSMGLSAGMSRNTATDKQIAGFLHFGTPDHGPKTAKMLSWISGGVRIFANKVRGISAKYWWGLTDTAKDKVRVILSEFYKNKLG